MPDRHRTVEQELVHQAKLREVREAIDGLPAKAARRGDDAQVPGDGVCADRGCDRVLRVGRAIAAVPGVRSIESALGAHGVNKWRKAGITEACDAHWDWMKAGAGGGLRGADSGPARDATFERHLKSCEACGEAVAAQQAVWEALDEWRCRASCQADFDRRLYSRIIDEDQAGWWPRKLDQSGMRRCRGGGGCRAGRGFLAESAQRQRRW